MYGQDEIIARAFDLGAADYVVKPFSPTELAARIRAALRRAAPERPEPAAPHVVGDLSVDFAQRRATLARRPVPLTPWSTGCSWSWRSTPGSRCPTSTCWSGSGVRPTPTTRGRCAQW